MPIQKIVIQTTILCATETLEEAVNAYSEMTLAEIHEATDFGDDIGSGPKIISSETLNYNEQVKRELLEMGNDGSFFDFELGLSDD